MKNDLVEVNVGYKITNKVIFEDGFNVVLGFKENALSGYQYVTWIQNSRGYDSGHYFSDKESALADMIERAIQLQNIKLKCK